MKPSLIIGSTGLLGRALVRVLQERRSPFLTLDRQKSQAQLPPTSHGYSITELEALLKKVDTVYLLAAHIPYDAMKQDHPQLHSANIQLPLDLTKQLSAPEHQAIRLVYASSLAVYGTPQQLPITLEHPYHSPSPYALSKLKGEQIIEQHPNSISLRFCSIYDHGMHQHTFLPKIIQKALTSSSITHYGNRDRLQHYLHAEDAAKMLIAAADRKHHGSHHAVSSTATSNQEIIELITACLPDCEVDYQHTDQHYPSTTYQACDWLDQAVPTPPERLASYIRQTCTPGAEEEH